MKNNLISTTLVGAILAFGGFTSCEKTDQGPVIDMPASGPDNKARTYLTLTGAYPDETGEAGNGGTKAFSITPEQAINPNFEINLFADGYPLRSQRTARVQGSTNGNFLYNIQYTGADGGVFNKYSVEGGNKFKDTNEEINTAPLLGTSPRWVVAADGIGVGVYASAAVTGSAEGAGANFVSVKSTAKIAVLDLNDPIMKYAKQEFEIPFTEEQKQNGYQIGRIDVPILNKAQNKLFIGCNLTRIDITKKSTLNSSGNQTWSTTTNQLGTATLVLDYPSLENPKLIFNKNGKANNHSYRTMTQYVGTDGHIYQATATSGSQFLRIHSATNTYDESYNFDLKTALSASNNIAIRAWKYVKDGIGLVMYTESGVNGGHLALVDLKAQTATKLTTDNQSDSGFSGLTAAQNGGTALVGTFGQFQNIGLIGDNLYVPMTPNGADGNIYVINYKTKSVTKGAKLKNQSGSFYIGAY